MNQVSVIVLVIVFLVLLSVILRSVRVVAEFQRLVILSLGRFVGVRGPGIILVMPWESATMVDLRERFLEIPRQTAITKDNAPISIDFLVYYRVIDPKRSVLVVDNVVAASLNIATTTLRAVIGDIMLDDVLAKREEINDKLRVKLDEITERWGLKITSVEIREIEPPRDVQDAMNRQNDRRAHAPRHGHPSQRRARVSRDGGRRSEASRDSQGGRSEASGDSQGAGRARGAALARARLCDGAQSHL